MRKTTPGIDRIEMTSLRRLKSHVESELTKHVHLCHDCSNAHGDIYRMCAEWWFMAKRLWKLKRQLRWKELEVDTRQMTLPGMDT